MFTLYANFKGGTGKSTVVFNMGLWLSARGKAVTVCDLDPQRTVSDARAANGWPTWGCPTPTRCARRSARQGASWCR